MYVCWYNRCYVVWAASGGLSFLWLSVSRPISPESSRPINGLCGWWLATPCQLPPTPWKHSHLAPRYTCFICTETRNKMSALKTTHCLVVCVCAQSSGPGSLGKVTPTLTLRLTLMWPPAVSSTTSPSTPSVTQTTSGTGTTVNHTHSQTSTAFIGCCIFHLLVIFYPVFSFYQWKMC